MMSTGIHVMVSGSLATKPSSMIGFMMTVNDVVVAATMTMPTTATMKIGQYLKVYESSRLYSW